MPHEPIFYLPAILRGIETGNVYPKDADTLRQIVGQLEQDIANLSAILEDALVFECGVTFKEEDTSEQ